MLAWALTRHLSLAGSVVIAWLGATATGMTTEILQQLHPARALELRDLVADMIGVTVMALLVLLLPRYRCVCWLRLR